MIINLIYSSIIFFIISNLTFLLSMIMSFLNMKIILSWTLFYLNSMNFFMVIQIDYISLIFISTVSLISSMVMIFSINYMKEEINLNRFFYLLLLFIFSMFLMILSPNILSILLGWDLLGLISYCLVIFFQNSMSFNSGMLTILCNRIGDIGILMSITLMLNFGSWKLLYKISFLITLMMMIASMTKSAQIPFSPWLPAAMAAPTPISALVHSSTLVTAGVYLMIKLNLSLMNNKLNFFLLIISSMTMFMSGMIANFEFDLKKIIALSTLSQLGLMMSILSIGMYKLAFFHLLTHAMFKSLLFLCAGNFIHCFNNNQDIRMYNNLMFSMPYMSVTFLISKLSLCGFPFLSGFYSKDLIMELFYMNKMIIIPMFFLMMGTIFTVSYSFMLINFMFFKKMNFYNINFIYENKLINYSTIMLLLMTMFQGSVINWLFFFSKPIILTLEMKLLTLFLCFTGILFYKIINMMNFKFFKKTMNFMKTMWFLNNLFKESYFYFLKKSNLLNENFEKGWMEQISKNSINNMMKISMFKSKKSINFNLNIFFMMMLISMFLIFFLI